MNEENEQPQPPGPPSPLDIWKTARDPKLRFIKDVPGAEWLTKLAILKPNSRHLTKVFNRLVSEQVTKYMTSGDPFYESYPAKGELPPLTKDRIHIADLPTGDVLSIPPEELKKNLLIVGAIGGGKTSFLRKLLNSSLEAGVGTIIAFDQKGDLADSFELVGKKNVLIFNWEELKLSFLHPPPNMPVSSFLNVLIEVLAGSLRLMASQRLMQETLEYLFRNQSQGSFPLFRNWVKVVKAWKVTGFNEAKYRDTVLYSLRSIQSSLGSILNHTSNHMTEMILRHSGVFIIKSQGLSSDAASLLASFIMMHCFETKQFNEDRRKSQTIFALDDSLRMVVGAHSSETEGRINPIAGWSIMGRSLNMGIIVSCQNYSLISPTLRQNTSNIIVRGSYGRDSRELATDLGLTLEQAAMLPSLKNNELVAMCRGVYPKALLGTTGEIQ